MKRVSAKLANMRKPQEFMVTMSDKGNIMIQSSKSIGMFNPETGKGLLNVKGCYFVHLSTLGGAKPYEFPAEFIAECKEALVKKGDLMGNSDITGPVYFGGLTEI